MKRSEMIDLISEFLDDHVTQDTAYAWKYSKNSSDILLNILEDAGMLPPNTAPDPYDIYCKWEPEEEL